MKGGILVGPHINDMHDSDDPRDRDYQLEVSALAVALPRSIEDIYLRQHSAGVYQLPRLTVSGQRVEDMRERGRLE